MFSKIALLALVAPLVSALTLNIPTNPTSGGSITVSWTTASGDPDAFSLELVNVDFHDTFAIANNLDPAQGSVTLQLPSVPIRDGYTLAAVNIGDISQVYSTTGSFSIGATSTGSVSTSASVSSTSSASLTSASSTRPLTSVTSSVSRSASASSASVSSIGSSVTSASVSASAASSTASSAASSKHVMNLSAGAVGAVLLSGFAGAAFLAL